MKPVSLVQRSTENLIIAIAAMSQDNRILSRVSAPLPPLSRFSGRPELDRSSARSNGLKRSSVGAHLAGKAPQLDRSSGSLQRASIELAARSEMHSSVVLNLCIESCVEGDAVYYKPDGQRFGQCETTVKLSPNVSYRWRLLTTPRLELLNGLVLVTTNQPNGNVHQDVVVMRPSDSGAKGLEGTWKCGLPTNRKGQRVAISVSGKIQNFGEFQVPFMAKVYKWSDSHRKLGSRLKSAVFNLRRDEDNKGNVEITVKSTRYAH